MAQAHAVVQVARRTRLLQAMGLQPYALRAGAEAAEDAGAVRCIALIAPGADADPRQQALIRHVLAALCLPANQLRQCVVRPGCRIEMISAQAWLAFGETQTRQFDAAAPAGVHAQANVVTIPEPRQLLREPLLKRDVWQSIKAVRRVLAAVAET